MQTNQDSTKTTRARPIAVDLTALGPTTIEETSPMPGFSTTTDPQPRHSARTSSGPRVVPGPAQEPEEPAASLNGGAGLHGLLRDRLAGVSGRVANLANWFRASTSDPEAHSRIEQRAKDWTGPLAGALRVAGAWWHERRTPGRNRAWLLSDAEAEQLAAPWARVAARFAPVVEGGDIGRTLTADVIRGVLRSAVWLRVQADVVAQLPDPDAEGHRHTMSPDAFIDSGLVS